MTRRALGAFVLRRGLGLLGVLVVLVVMTFMLVRLVPGDPALRVAGVDASAEELSAIRADLGLDRPVLQQFGDYVGDLARLDLGTSFLNNQDVGTLIRQRLPATLQLVVLSVVLVLVVALSLGLAAAAWTQNDSHRGFDRVFTTALSGLAAVPETVAAPIAIAVFAVWLGWFPAAGNASPLALVLPLTALCVRPIAVLSRIVRVEALNVLATDYIRTARSKRLPARLVYFRHALPGITNSALTLAGLLFASLMGGAAVVEVMFDIRGLGSTLAGAILGRDYPVVQMIVLVYGLMVVVVNAVVDLAIFLIDPRAATVDA